MQLLTARLLLRPFAEDDLPQAGYLTEGELPALLGIGADSAAALALLRREGLCAQPALWALCGRESGALLGHVRYAPLEGEDAGAWELFCAVAPAFRRRALASEICRALTIDAFSRREAAEIVSFIPPQAAAGRALARRLGMTPRGQRCGALRFVLAPFVCGKEHSL